ncbi:MAG: epimerase [Alphaproteobacteria bacterium HGW-Alphaproteobacteria-2]|nr:MAG: epimerase [Alphaproteobacteria bacterium HGW-Alphaproteobacteria-2]
MRAPPPPVALTGATGFVGRALMRELARRGVAVRALTRRGPEGAGWVRGDLDDPGALARLAEGARVLVHVAGATHALGRAGYDAVNVTGAARVAEAVRTAGVAHLVHLSSLAARRPAISPYAASKHAGEQVVLAEAGDATVTLVRPPAVIGPGDRATKPLIDAMRLGLLTAPMEPAGVERRFSVIHVDDLARLLADLALGLRPGGELVDMAGTREVTWARLAEAAGAATGRRVRLLRLPAATLHLVGAAGDALSALTGRPGMVSRGKMREMLAEEWLSAAELDGAMGLEAALASCLGPQEGETAR